jgi:hypothetical protein
MQQKTAAGMTLAVAFGTLGMGAAHAASVFQVTTTQTVTQDILTLRGHPGFKDPNPFLADPYIFFDDHVRILTEEADVFDPTQIPASPADVPFPEDFNVISTAQVRGTWTFDADLLKGIDLGRVASSTDDGQLLGRTGAVSTFVARAGGDRVGDAVTTSTAVYALNDVAAGVGGERLDVIGLVAEETPEPFIESSGIILFLAGSENWFENAAGAIPDFNDILVSSIDYRQVVSSDAGEELYEETISNDPGAYALTFAGFGAADGSSEGSPLLPVTATADPTAPPAFTFDVSSAGVDFVFVDPEIAVGYTYFLEGGGSIAKFKAPTLDAVNDPDGYTLVLPDGSTFDVLPGQVVDFVAEGYGSLTTFDIVGISEDLMIDPENFTTFVGGFLFSGAGAGSNLTQTAIVVDIDAAVVPLPPAFAAMLAGLGGLGLVARRGRRTA